VKKRKRTSFFALRNLLKIVFLLVFLLVLLFLYSRMVSSPIYLANAGLVGYTISALDLV